MKNTLLIVTLILVTNSYSQGLISKLLNINATVELGVIPGHDVSLYDMSSYNPSPNKICNVYTNQVFYTGFRSELDITKYIFINGELISYELGTKTAFNFYPIRIDFKIGGGLRYKWFEIGVNHSCYHPLAPNVLEIPRPKIDVNENVFYTNIKRNDSLKFVAITSTIGFNTLPSHSISVYQTKEQNIVNIDKTYDIYYDAKFDILKYGFINCGSILSFTSEYKNKIDFNVGGGFQYGFIKIGYDYGSIDPATPGVDNFSLLKVNNYQHNFYIKAFVGK